ncbi:hypothetical protein DSM14862_02264 [Sulfitobacter indolifex]|nr:hypothetical protein DSM14862_02264 [Sulfitobacter indolifex]
MNQTAHISLQISNFQTALRQKKLRCALSSWRAPPLVPRIFPLYRTKPPRFRFRPPRLAPRWCISAPPVWGVLRLVAQTRKQKFEKRRYFWELIRNSLFINVICVFQKLSLGPCPRCIAIRRHRMGVNQPRFRRCLTESRRTRSDSHDCFAAPALHYIDISLRHPLCVDGSAAKAL